MHQELETRTHVRFGNFEADLKAGELRRSGVRVRIQGQPFKVLTVLLEHAGEVVSREELQRRLWGAETTVDFDHSIGIAINKLREALGDSADNPRFVETLARRGYRFIAPLTIDAAWLGASEPTQIRDAVGTRAPTRRVHPWLLGMAIFAAVGLGLLLIVSLRPPSRIPRHIARLTYSGRVLEPKIDEDNNSAVVTDGSRLFFSHVENAQTVLAETLIANGEIREFKLPSEIDSPIINSISPDQGNLIVHNALANDAEQPVWIVPTLGGNAQRVPNLFAHDAAWMPDGRRILYASYSSLFVVRADGTDAQKFAELPGWAFWLRWSPDGSQLRFSLRDGNHQTTSLWEMNSRGGNLHQILPDWSSPSAECCGSWTADGRSFVFQSRRFGHSDLWMRDETSLGAAAPVQLTNGPLDYESPVTSPTGRRVYFIGANANIELLRFDSQLKQFVGLENALSSPSLNVYSRDGQWVAWLSLMDGSLWRSRVDGSERLRLTSSPIRVFMMRWSPDNKQLAIMAQQPGSPWRIYLEDAAGGRLDPILNDTRSEADPNWSTDGTSLVFGRAPEAMSTGQEPQAIHLAKLATHEATEIPGSTGLFSPRLSPTGRYIAAINVASRSLMLFDRQTSTWRKLSDHEVGDPLWSADGRYIYFQDDHELGKPIYRVDIASGALDRVATLDSLRPLAALDYRLVSLAPGDLPVVSAWTSNVNLYSIDLDQ
jgi:Tol biopolymer transport system component/DNA-binding winged helix-turn-helix (wHTH) protein